MIQEARTGHADAPGYRTGEMVARPLDVLVPVWGSPFVATFLELVLPSLLAPGNLPALSAAGPVSLRLVTDPADEPALRASPMITAAARHVAIDIEIRDTASDPALSHLSGPHAVFAREIMRAKEAGRDVIIWCADAIVADGAWASVARVRALGRRCAFTCAARADKDALSDRLKGREGSDGVLAVPAGELVRLTRETMHPWSLALSLNAPAAESAGVYRLEGDGGFVAMSLFLHPVYLDTRAAPSDVARLCLNAIDGDLPSWLDCAPDEIHYFQDSDDFYCVEVTEASAGAGALPSPDPTRSIANATSEWAEALSVFAARHLFGRPGIDRYLANLAHPVVCHGGEAPPPSRVRQSSDALLDHVRKTLNDTRAIHRDAPNPGWGWLGDPAQTPPLPPTIRDDVRFHHTVAVWGERFTDLFLRACLPSLLSPGNIPALASNPRSTFDIYTTADDAERMVVSSAIARLRRHIRVRFHVVSPDDEHRLFDENRYDVLAAFHRQAYAEALPIGATLTFISPDSIFSDGSLRTTERHVEAGCDAVLVTAIRTTLEDVRPWLDTRLAPDGNGALSSDEMVSIAIRHLHPTTRRHVWGGDRFNSDWPSQIFWPDGPDLMIAHCWQLHPMAIRPSGRAGGDFEEAIDGDFLAKALSPTSHVRILQDSRQFCVLELSRREHGAESAHRPSPFDPARFRAWASGTLEPVHRQFIRHPFIYRGGDVSDERLKASLERASSVVGGLLRQSDDPLATISRLHHPDELRGVARLFIYGAGMAGRRVRDALGHAGVATHAFVDTTREGMVDGIPLMTADHVAPELREGDMVLVTSQYANEILGHLRRLGVPLRRIMDGYRHYRALDRPPPPTFTLTPWFTRDIDAA